MVAGRNPCLSSCHNVPLAGRSKSQANSNKVIPRLKISAFFENVPLKTSGAKYLESPSVASNKFYPEKKKKKTKKKKTLQYREYVDEE